MSKPEFEVSLLEVDVSTGINNYAKKMAIKNGFTTDYQIEKACGFHPGNINAIRKSGGCSMLSLYKLGLGAGYKGNNINIMIRVLKDFKGDK